VLPLILPENQIAGTFGTNYLLCMKAHCFHQGLRSLSSALALAVALGLTIGVAHAGAKGDKGKAAKVKKVEKTSDGAVETTVVTGSLIPQKINKGRIPISTSPLYVINEQDIQRSGRVSLAGILRMHGGR
jgi:outer membrane cobalamin receptor